MLVTISDTSPVRTLNHLGLLPLLHDLYGSVQVPDEVWEELYRPIRPRFVSIDLRPLPHFTVTSIATAGVDPLATLPPALLARLDAGERAAIRLAVDTSADLLLIDEMAGRQAAALLGLNYVGTLGVLVRASQDGRIGLVRPLMDDLRSGLGFFISRSLYRHVLNLVGE